MPVTVVLHHTTSYTYERPATLSPQTIRLRPAPHCRTPILSYGIKIQPAQHFLNWLQDPQGNYLARVVFPEKVSEFKVEVSVVAEMIPINPFDFFVEEYADNFPFEYDEHLRDELQPYLDAPEGVGPKWQALFDKIDRSPKQIVYFLVDLNRDIQHAVAYTVRMEAGIQTPEETLEKGSGSCRDSAWLLINILRGLGLAARFASGYLIQLTADQKSIDGPSGPSQDFTDLHAWAEVYLPGAGWVGLDPTSGLLAGEGHIPLACSPNPTTAAPITGLVENVESQFDFSMSIDRLKDPPRATKPYSDSQWEAIQQAGHTVDDALRQSDIQLTMGGEPTFISCDNPDAPEWNGAAVGKEKLGLSEIILRRLNHRFASGSLLHYGQGKWYPGESYPRWAFTCYWRKDGKPLWKNPELFDTVESDGDYTEEDAARFGRALAERLGVKTDFLLPVYEDVGYYLWREAKLPPNVDAVDSKLRDPEERSRLAQVFRRGLDAPRGFSLPLAYQQWQGRWVSGSWPTRHGKVFLLPGDSPAGLRLPLDTLPYQKAPAPLVQADPFSISVHAPFSSQAGNEPSTDVYPPADAGGADANTFATAHAPVPEPSDASGATTPEQRPGGQRRIESPEAPRDEQGNEIRPQVLDEEPELKSGESADWVVRTAFCVEPRNGHLYLFIPPLPKFDAYFELIQAIEATAAELDLKIVIEGERPPYDPRINQFSITPDPGVVEVNIHPAANWSELLDTTTALYDEAAHARLKPDKLMQDGRQTGSGGGCHLVVGGQTPAESPFLRDPSLLGSMICYWQRHPSLSFLFSGLFIGPTSQSPRIDEARHDSLYEMEIALAELKRQPASPPPWVVDRLFRNLLTDLTGNTHRAEFCIDKLYNPDRSSGRLGLLELRAFEMPPHAQMCVSLQLLVRSLIAMLSQRPYQPRRLVRWGSELHDRFMLPHYVWDDFQDVISDLESADLPIELDWYQPHFQFRFPMNGKFNYKEIEIELRQAIEPWHTLGEEAMAGGTARYVDSSLERLQIKASQLLEDRYEIRCNRIPLPLTNTGRKGEYVAGLRYRAWQPPFCLHPTITVDTPLYIDLVDTWTSQTVAGCRYHPGHPGGRSYEDSPVNTLEADGRWRAKFDLQGQSPGPAPEARPAPKSMEYPMTLDLRLAR